MRNGKAVAALILVVTALVANLLYSGQEQDPSAYRVIVTAAHLGRLAGYTKVYEDTETDYAVHVKNTYYSGRAAVGDRVEFAGTYGTVASVLAKEFRVEVSDISKVVPGVSGTPVYNKRDPIGYVSGWSDGQIRCIFY